MLLHQHFCYSLGFFALALIALIGSWISIKLSVTQSCQKQDEMAGQNLQIDLIKTFAIFSVILVHTVSIATFSNTGMVFYSLQAVPLFIICTGIVWYLSFLKYDTTLSGAYSYSYLKSKFSRLIIPFLVIVTVDFIYIHYTGTVITLNHLIARLELLQPPIGGGGDFYLALVWQLIFLAPLICYCFKRNPMLAVIGLFTVNFAFEFAGPIILFEYYYFSICRYLAAFALGLVLAHNIHVNGGWKIRSKVNVALIILGLVSALYLYFFFGKVTPGFRQEWGTQNVYSFFYPALIAMLLLSAEPLTRHAKGVFRRLSVFGRASYHIFLVQMVYWGFGYYSIFYTSNELRSLIINLGVTFSFGLLFYGVDLLARRGYNEWLLRHNSHEKESIAIKSA
jgi:peptidoglycan/LPS O-acetylase OafA/YrhL